MFEPTHFVHFAVKTFTPGYEASNSKKRPGSHSQVMASSLNFFNFMPVPQAEREGFQCRESTAYLAILTTPNFLAVPIRDFSLFVKIYIAPGGNWQLFCTGLKKDDCDQAEAQGNGCSHVESVFGVSSGCCVKLTKQLMRTESLRPSFIPKQRTTQGASTEGCGAFQTMARFAWNV